MNYKVILMTAVIFSAGIALGQAPARIALAQDGRCLAVYPVKGNARRVAVRGGVAGLMMAHGERYGYIEEKGLTLSSFTRASSPETIKSWAWT